MSTKVQLIGRELCFWCIEAFRGCHLHDNTDVFWNDVAVRSYSEGDAFEIVDEKELIDVESRVFYSSGKFSVPPTASSTPISTIFRFEKCEKPARNVPETQVVVKPKRKYTKRKGVIQREITEKIPEVCAEKSKERKSYGSIHRNAVKTIPPPYTRGRKCNYEEKLFVCDICEMSFTLRHNLQVHLVQFHGDTANVSEEKFPVLKEMLNRKGPLTEAAEAFLVQVLSESNLAAIHDGRTTIKTKDMKYVVEFLKRLQKKE
ncbi:unnamed protein product [Caenorhabditis sp. 36 PRJEB53466]|nr:unnamed protein product [Caenorhabditis sp. 36 PRJEB53466]